MVLTNEKRARRKWKWKWYKSIGLDLSHLHQENLFRVPVKGLKLLSLLLGNAFSPEATVLVLNLPAKPTQLTDNM
jgi:hypothetical protein